MKEKNFLILRKLSRKTEVRSRKFTTTSYKLFFHREYFSNQKLKKLKIDVI